MFIVYAKILGFGSSLNLLSATIQIYFPIPVIYSTGIRKIPRDFTIKKLCIHIISSKLLELTKHTLKYRTETNPNMQDSSNTLLSWLINSKKKGLHNIISRYGER